ncbi:MAG TPA: carboxypeptidase M32 [Oligoflexia bacterium]|nr:carboxypeptidase M32 [Oligoflexia bacterium]HMP26863.1 carboxypeptidase M32 [Oligoflexia bacterium]
MDKTKLLAEFYDFLKEQSLISNISSLLGWDQETIMPRGSGAGRVAQIEYVSRLYHKKRTDPKFLEIVDALWEIKEELTEDDSVNVREVKRDIDKTRKLPEDFVAHCSALHAKSNIVWQGARKNNDWRSVESLLTEIFKFARERAELLGYSEHPYDALLDDYEPGAKISQTKTILLDLAERLRALMPAILEKQKSKATSSVTLKMSQEDQAKLCRKILNDIGFDFSKGRLDLSAHPFSTSIGKDDQRITYRFQDQYIASIYGALHEGGHALYEIGLKSGDWHESVPLANTNSCALHESQSRFWENIIGRSLHFCRYLERIIKDLKLTDVESFTAEKLWDDANTVSPSLIRVEADEVTYSLHIVIRMLLEEKLLEGSLAVADAPEAWNDLYHRYLGLTPPNYADGIMQDTHWYHGAIGYFPSYALGNIYGAHFTEKLKADLIGCSELVEKGKFAPIFDWLKQNIHRFASRYQPMELIERASGGMPVSSDAFVGYIQNKFLA